MPAGTVGGAAVRSQCPKRAAGHVMLGVGRIPSAPGGRCYWCNEALTARERIARAVAIIRRHVPDIAGDELEALSHHLSDLERVAEVYAATAHAGADDA